MVSDNLTKVQETIIDDICERLETVATLTRQASPCEYNSSGNNLDVVDEGLHTIVEMRKVINEAADLFFKFKGTLKK